MAHKVASHHTRTLWSPNSARTNVHPPRIAASMKWIVCGGRCWVHTPVIAWREAMLCPALVLLPCLRICPLGLPEGARALPLSPRQRFTRRSALLEEFCWLGVDSSGYWNWPCVPLQTNRNKSVTAETDRSDSAAIIVDREIASCVAQFGVEMLSRLCSGHLKALNTE